MNKVLILSCFIITTLARVNTVKNMSPVRSPQHLIVLAEMELNIFNILDEYSKVRSNSNSVRLLNGYREDFDESYLTLTAHLNPTEAAMLVSKNPILSYRMIRRYSKILQNLHTEMTNNTDSELLRRITSVKSGNNVFVNWPSNKDLNDAMESIIRLHHIYEFDLDQFTSGNIMGTQTHAQLNTIHCQELGKYALKIKHYYSAVIWLEEALKMTKKSSSLGNLSQIKKLLSDATEAHDMAWELRDKWDYNFFSRKLSETTNMKTRKAVRKIEYEKNKGKKIPCFKDFVNFWELCSTGKSHQTEEQISKLFCFYDTNSSPMWTINPLKVEQLSISPFVVQFYDILGDKTIDAIKEEVYPNLAHSVEFRVGKTSVRRIATGALLDDPSENFRHLTRRVELISGLQAGPHEKIQIASYSFGGFVQTHMDSEHGTNPYGGDSSKFIASFMFNLEDTEIGGLTVFPRIGVVARPIKGSGIYWFNTFKNGQFDDNACHAGCPVLLGHKWLAVKRIRSKAQMFTRPCGLNPEE